MFLRNRLQKPKNRDVVVDVDKDMDIDIVEDRLHVCIICTFAFIYFMCNISYTHYIFTCTHIQILLPTDQTMSKSWPNFAIAVPANKINNILL